MFKYFGEHLMYKKFKFLSIILFICTLNAFSRIAINWESVHDFTMNQTFTAMTTDSSGNVYLTGDVDIVKWDGVNWTIYEDALIGDQNLLAVDNKGTLYAAAIKTYSYNFIINKWNGTSWERITNEIKGYIRSMLTDNDGNLYISGKQISVNGVDMPYLGKWDGNSWSSWGEKIDQIDTLLTRFEVNRVKKDINDDLYVNFMGIDSAESPKYYKHGIAKWNNGSWETVLERETNISDFTFNKNNKLFYSSESRVCYLDSGKVTSFGTLAANFVSNIYLDSAENVYVTGDIDYVDGDRVQGFARWDGSEWGDLNSNLYYTTEFLFFDKNNDLHVTNANQLHKYDTTVSRDWYRVGEGEFIQGEVNQVVTDSKGNAYFAGDIRHFGNVDQGNVIKWDGTNWTGETVVTFQSFTVDKDDTLYIADEYWDCVHKLTGSGEQKLGNNLDGELTFVESHNNILYVVGDLEVDGDSCAVAQWDGTKWLPMKMDNSAPKDSGIYKINSLAYYNKNLYAAARLKENTHEHCLLQWDGDSWIHVNETPVFYKFVGCIVANDNGLYAIVGIGSSNNYKTAQWDGNNWIFLGEDFPKTFFLYTAFNNLFAVKRLSSYNWIITLWNDAQKVWEPFDGEFNGPISSLATTPDSNMIVVGDFNRAGNTKAAFIAKCKLNMVTSISETPFKADELANKFTFAPNPVSQSEDQILFRVPHSVANKWEITISDNVGNQIDHQSFTSFNGHIYSWDLKNSAGKKVAPGTYSAKISYIKPNGETGQFEKIIGVKR